MDETADAVAAAKRAAGYQAADMVEDGMVIGLGTGSTVFYASNVFRAGSGTSISVPAVPTSYQTAMSGTGIRDPVNDT